MPHKSANGVHRFHLSVYSKIEGTEQNPQNPSPTLFCWEQASTMMFHIYIYIYINIFTEWNGTSTTSFKDG